MRDLWRLASAHNAVRNRHVTCFQINRRCLGCVYEGAGAAVTCRPDSGRHGVGRETVSIELGAFSAVDLADRHRHQLEMRVLAMLGVAQQLIERHP
jgi:hypothetical protein